MTTIDIRLRLTPLLDHLVREREQIVGNSDAKRLGSLQVDDEFELERLDYRQVTGFGTLENFRRVGSVLVIRISDTCTVAQQPSRDHVFAKLVDCRQTLSLREGDNSIAACIEIRIGCDQECPRALPN